MHTILRGLTDRSIPSRIQADPNARKDEAGFSERRSRAPLNEGEGDTGSTASSILPKLKFSQINFPTGFLRGYRRGRHGRSSV